MILLANGLCGGARVDSTNDPRYPPFVAALTTVCVALAQAIVRDGEGATRFVTIHVNGTHDDAQAHAAANTVATSPLVKTALLGGMPTGGASWLPSG